MKHDLSLPPIQPLPTDQEYEHNEDYPTWSVSHQLERGRTKCHSPVSFRSITHPRVTEELDGGREGDGKGIINKRREEE